MNLQSCIKVTKLFVEFYVTVPTLQFWHRFLVFISCRVVGIRSDLVCNLFILRDGVRVSSALKVHLSLIAFPGVYILCLYCKEAGGTACKTICWPSPCSQRSDLLSQLCVMQPELLSALLELQVKSSVAGRWARHAVIYWRWLPAELHIPLPGPCAHSDAGKGLCCQLLTGAAQESCGAGHLREQTPPPPNLSSASFCWGWRWIPITFDHGQNSSGKCEDFCH